MVMPTTFLFNRAAISNMLNYLAMQGNFTKALVCMTTFIVRKIIMSSDLTDFGISLNLNLMLENNAINYL